MLGAETEAWLRSALGDPEDEEYDLSAFRFPTDHIAEDYVADAASRPQREIKELLRRFLFPSGSFGVDSVKAQLDAEFRREQLYEDIERDELPEFYRRRLKWWDADSSDEVEPPWQGITWVIDLLPDNAASAVAAIDAYITAHLLVLPDGRINGLSDAMDIISGHYLAVGPDQDRYKSALSGLSPRDLEVLLAVLFTEMKYEVSLTRFSKDLGYDVVAIRSRPGQSETVLVSCKQSEAKVGPDEVDRVVGLLARAGGTRGVIAAPGGFTNREKGSAVQTAAKHSSIELLGTKELASLLNEHLGYLWPARLQSTLSFRRRQFKPVAT